MSEMKNDGGPAFPQVGSDFIDHPTHGRVHRAAVGMEALPGMSLRDWFAGQVAGLGDDCDIEVGVALAGRPYPSKEVDQMQWWAEADAAYRYMKADAMLSARSAR